MKQVWCVAVAVGLAIEICSPPRPVYGATVVVGTTADSGAGSLREAISTAHNGDRITLTARGKIILTSGSLTIDKDLTIVGPGANSLAISGNNASRVFTLERGVTVSFTDLTMTEGNGMGTGAPGIGGGIFALGSTLTINRCVVTGNHAEFGGGIANLGSVATVGTLTIISSAVSNNTASTVAGGVLNGATPPISSGTNLSVAIINDSQITGNSAGTANPCNPRVCGAGGIGNAGTMMLTDSTVNGNTAVAGGAGGVGNTGVLTIVASTISDNDAAAGGGGLTHVGSNLATLINSTISGNSTPSLGGGGIGNAGLMQLSNVTVTRNVAAAGTGGGIGNGCFQASCGRLTVRNSLVAGNTAGGDCADDPLATFTSDHNNLSGDSTCPFTASADRLAVGDARLGALANNGGPTQTHALLPGSAAIDAGNSTGCADASGTPLTTDQRAVHRPQGSACDIGAFESSPGGGGGCSISAHPDHAAVVPLGVGVLVIWRRRRRQV